MTSGKFFEAGEKLEFLIIQGNKGLKRPERPTTEQPKRIPTRAGCLLK